MVSSNYLYLMIIICLHTVICFNVFTCNTNNFSNLTHTVNVNRYHPSRIELIRGRVNKEILHSPQRLTTVTSPPDAVSGHTQNICFGGCYPSVGDRSKLFWSPSTGRIVYYSPITFFKSLWVILVYRVSQWETYLAEFINSLSNVIDFTGLHSTCNKERSLIWQIIPNLTDGESHAEILVWIQRYSFPKPVYQAMRWIHAFFKSIDAKWNPTALSRISIRVTEFIKTIIVMLHAFLRNRKDK